MKIVQEKACFDMSLQNACRAIGIGFLVLLTIGAIVHPALVNASSSLIGFILEIIGNVALVFGAYLSNQWLVLVWIVQAVLYYIGWPIAVLGVIFNYGDFRRAAFFDNVFLILLEYIINLIIFTFLARIVYSYWQQLRNNQSNPQHAVVV